MISQTKANLLDVSKRILVDRKHYFFVLIDYVYDSVFICIACVWEEMGDVLHGLGEDGGCTSKPVNS